MICQKPSYGLNVDIPGIISVVAVAIVTGRLQQCVYISGNGYCPGNVGGWHLPAAIAGTYAVVEHDPTTGRMSGLALTVPQRDEILKKLSATFGDQVTHGVQAGQFSLVAAAAAVYHVIGNQKRTPREK